MPGVFLFCLAALPVFAQTGNLITNGQFDFDPAKLTNVGSGYGYFADKLATDNLDGWTYTYRPSDEDWVAHGVNDFRQSGPQPAGNIAFFQQSADVSTTINGLTPGETYILSFQYAARDGHKGGGIMAALDGKTIMPNQFIPAFNQGGYLGTRFYNYVYEFTPTGTSMPLEFGMNINREDDWMAFLANVSVQHVNDYTGGWRSLRFFENDASLGVTAGNMYTHAYNFATLASPTVNGLLTFTGINDQNFNGNTFSISAPNAHEHGPAGTIYDGPEAAAAYALLTNSFYNNPIMTLSGLMPGFEYEMTLIASNYGATQNRASTFTVNGENSAVFRSYGYADTKNIGQEGVLLTWQGKASADGNIVLQLSQANGDTWHVCGVMNRFVSEAMIKEGVYMATGFGGLMGENNGKYVGDVPVFDPHIPEAIAGTTMDHINLLSPGARWQNRGHSIQAVNVPTVENGYVKSGANSGLAIDFNAEPLLGGKVTISADICLKTLQQYPADYDQHKDDENHAYYTYDPYAEARGLGIGFFSSSIGAGNLSPNLQTVDCGFTGLVISPAGEIFFLTNMTNDQGGGYVNTVIPFDTGTFGDFSQLKDDFLHIDIDLLIDPSGVGATLIGLNFNGSAEGYYADLYDSRFETLDMIGFFTSATAWGSEFGYFDNFVVTGYGPLDDTSDAPEPAA